MTQLEAAKRGMITEEMRTAAAYEGVEPEKIRKGLEDGSLVLPKNVNHNFRPRAIGAGMRTKVNANIGTSADHGDIDEEILKLEVSIQYGADSVMDLSTGGDLPAIRREMIARSSVMLGTVPIYEVSATHHLTHFSADDFFEVIERQAKQGVDYITVHCGVTKESLKRLGQQDRITGIVSRGGALQAAWIRSTGKENPLYEHYDRLLEIAAQYDVTLSLGDGLRPGGTADATDAGQLAELMVLGELQKRALARGVQAMIEGPGHVPLDQIEANVLIEKRLCNNAPFYVLGPLPTDVAPGYDHITGAIGGAIAAAKGVDMLCYLTPAEHLRLPNADDVREGVIATKIAAHIGDMVKNVPGARAWDDEMSRRRKALDWEGMFSLAIDPVKARHMRIHSEDYEKAVCTMCGPLCSINVDNSSTKREQSSLVRQAERARNSLL